MTTGRSRLHISSVLAATLVVLGVSVLGQAVGAHYESSGLSVFAVTAFAGALLRLGWQLNAPWWQTGCPTVEIGPAGCEAQPALAARNTRLIALCYAWGAASLLAVYLFTSLRWQHGWQYGAGMGVIAALLFWGSRSLSQTGTPTRHRALIWASLIHGWAATAGMGWMIGIGKMHSIKGDWAANLVFMGGGLIVVGLTIMALRTTRILAAAQSA
jgi:hypothetical protein